VFVPSILELARASRVEYGPTRSCGFRISYPRPCRWPS